MERAYFNNIQNEIVSRLSNATKEVLVAVAWFTNESIFEEILKCLSRHVSVTLVLINDAINRNELGLDFSKYISSGGILYFSNDVKVHHKFCLIDEILITGSYNWTYYAETYNAENIIISDNANLVEGYQKEFERLLSICERVTKYEALKLDNISKEELYKDYDYLCNDLLLKGERYGKIVTEINKKRNIYLNLESKKLRKNCIDEDIKLDSRGIPFLKKSRKITKSIRRLVNLSIECVPNGRPNYGRKYVHALYISNDIWEENVWVDIFDSEYVEFVTHYFHKKDGGVLDDNSKLPSIPVEIYDPASPQFHFKHICYTFYVFGDDKGRKMKIGKNGRVLEENGKPYIFKHFHTLIRYNEILNDYVEFKSMTELCHLIIKSLFIPNVPNDNDFIWDYLCPTGTFRASIDDFEVICREVEGVSFPNATISSNQIKEELINCPEGVWLLKSGGQILACSYGIYVNLYNSGGISSSDSNGDWYYIRRLKKSLVSSNENVLEKLLTDIVSNLKNEGRKGVLYKCSQKSIEWISFFENYGFKKENLSGLDSNFCIMRLNFTI